MSGVDHGEAKRLRQSLEQGRRANADAVGERAQTRHLELSPFDDAGAEAMWDVARDAARATPPRLERLRFVTITTDSAGSFASWVRSLRAALDDAGWVRGRGPDIEVLRVANGADVSIEAANREVAAEGISIRVVEADRERRPLPLAEARPLAFRALRELGWVPSRSTPVWSLDEDFRFDTLVPSPARLFVRRSGGPLFHRLDALVARLAADCVDVVVGGNTGAAPVPTLGLMLRQLLDLATGSGARTDPAALASFSRFPDAYYDLAEEPTPELRVSLSRGWWRDDGNVGAIEVARRLQSGLPVTRPALAMPLRPPASAWATFEHTGAAGGNTLLLSAHPLDAGFVHIQQGALVSRRADTTWVIGARTQGAKVRRACLPLFHDRQRRPQAPVEAAREALADALGVGLYRSMLAGDATEATTLARTEARLGALRASLVEAEATARRVGVREHGLDAMVDWLAQARAALVLGEARPTFVVRSAAPGCN